MKCQKVHSTNQKHCMFLPKTGMGEVEYVRIQVPNPNSPTATTFPTFEEAISYSCCRQSSGVRFLVLSNSIHLVGWQPTVQKRRSTIEIIVICSKIYRYQILQPIGLLLACHLLTLCFTHGYTALWCFKYSLELASKHACPATTYWVLPPCTCSY